MSNKLNVIQLNPEATGLPALILLHGFTGRASDWLETAENLTDVCRIYLPDLPGCGESAAPEDNSVYTAEGLSKLISETVSGIPGKKIIGGYSMGARAALVTAVNNPEVFSGMVLVSGTAGISSPDERQARIESDLHLADSVITKGTEVFINEWMDNPLFAGLKRLPAEKYREITDNKINCPAEVLSSWLINFSTGRMPDLWPLLPGIETPAMIVHGEEDAKFASISKRMSGIIKNSELYEVKGAGHNVHQEKPFELAEAIRVFINKNIK